MIRSFLASNGTRHTLDLETVHLDGAACITIHTDGTQVVVQTARGETTCHLEQFWHDLAGGPDLSTQEAGCLLVNCLARQIVLQRITTALDDLMRQLAWITGLPAEIPSFEWLSTRLDPLAYQAMSAYDGSEAMTEMLARILHQSPATIHQWARQLNLVVAPTPAPIAEALGTVETLAEAETRERFSWTPERSQELAAALEACTGGTVAERARQIAAAHGWPEVSVRSKLYEMQRSHRTGQSAARETENAEAEKEDDQRVAHNAVTV